mmetsp:Transcript_87107/g.246636  ORF Transcript_87107/g.246636 Transcript_87107/m.246636 type:complete len:304 (-) Transcript_87107:300-1211(-)
MMVSSRLTKSPYMLWNTNVYVCLLSSCSSALALRGTLWALSCGESSAGGSSPRGVTTSVSAPSSGHTAEGTSTLPSSWGTPSTFSRRPVPWPEFSLLMKAMTGLTRTFPQKSIDTASGGTWLQKKASQASPGAASKVPCSRNSKRRLRPSKDPRWCAQLSVSTADAVAGAPAAVSQSGRCKKSTLPRKPLACTGTPSFEFTSNGLVSALSRPWERLAASPPQKVRGGSSSMILGPPPPGSLPGDGPGAAPLGLWCGRMQQRPAAIMTTTTSSGQRSAVPLGRTPEPSSSGSPGSPGLPGPSEA